MKPIDLNGECIKLTPTTSVNRAALPAGCQQVRIHNAGTSGAFVASAVSNATPVVDQSTYIPPGNTEVFTVDQSHRSIGAICGSGSTTIYGTCAPGN